MIELKDFLMKTYHRNNNNNCGIVRVKFHIEIIITYFFTSFFDINNQFGWALKGNILFSYSCSVFRLKTDHDCVYGTRWRRRQRNQQTKRNQIKGIDFFVFSVGFYTSFAGE